MSFFSTKSELRFFLFLSIGLKLSSGENPSASSSSREVDNLITKRSEEFDVKPTEFTIYRKKEILNWQPPYDLKKSLPYFLSGFDDDGCPLWIAEIGKWDTRATIETFGYEQVQKYIRQMLTTFYTSGERERNKEVTGRNQTEHGECENLEYNAIVDMDEFSNRQFVYPQTVTTYLNLARTVFSLESKGQKMKKVFVINSNYLASTLYSVGSPLIGSLASRVTLFGTNPASWKPTLLKTFPKSALPDWMGGFKDFKPIRVNG